MLTGSDTYIDLSCPHGVESPECYAAYTNRLLQPSLPTEDIVDDKPFSLRPIFTRDSWMFYWQTKFGPRRHIADYLFSHLDQMDFPSNDGFLDISSIPESRLEESLSHFHSTDEAQEEVLDKMKEELTTYRKRTLEVFYVTEYDNKLVAVDEDGNIVGLYSKDLQKTWADIKLAYPETTAARLVVDRQVFAGYRNDPLNPARQGLLRAHAYRANPAVTGGLGVYDAGSSIEVLPYEMKLMGFDPTAIEVAATVTALVIAVIAVYGGGKRGHGGPVPVMATTQPGPLTRLPITISLPEHVERTIKEAIGRRFMPTIFLAKSGQRERGMEDFLSPEEIAGLTPVEINFLQRNIIEGNKLNRRFERSNYYPLPRDLCFPPEKPLLAKWSQGKKDIVEIGVFEGGSALVLRKSMASDGTLHLIDPFVKIPDSDLTAREWMAKVNLMRSGNGEVIWYRDYSYNIAGSWQRPIEVLFIDGDHSESACRQDWIMWHPFVAEGGVVLFHDARLGRGGGEYWDGWPGPTHVVGGLFRGQNKLPNWKIVDEETTLVVVQRIK